MSNLKPNDEVNDLQKKLEKGNKILRERFSHYFCGLLFQFYSFFKTLKKNTNKLVN
jgi:hypothetical protein